MPQLLLKTPYSEVRLLANVPWSSFADKPEGTLHALLTASLGKEDLFTFAGTLPDELKKSFPTKPLSVTTGVEGNLAALRLRQLKGEIPGTFNLDISGKLQNITDSITRSGDFQLDAKTGNLNFILSMLPAKERARYNIPKGMRLTVEGSLRNGEYQAQIELLQDKGKFELSARFNPLLETYGMDLRTDSLEPVHFLPQDSLYRMTVSLHAEGKGYDPFSARTHAKVDGTISDILYGASSIADVTLKGSLEKNLLLFDLKSLYPLAKIDMSLNATLLKKEIKAMLIADVDNLDLYGMHLMTDSLATSFQLFSEAKTDMGKNNLIDVTLGNWELITNTGKFRPKTLTLHAQSTVDTTGIFPCRRFRHCFDRKHGY